MMKKMFKPHNVIFFLSCILPSLAYSLTSDPAADLMFAFGSRCHGRGQFNEAATADSKALTDIIVSIRNDPSCGGVANSLADIQGLNFSSMHKSSVNKLDYEDLVTTAADLELAIRSERTMVSPDDIYIRAMSEELNKVKLDLVKTKGTDGSELARRRFQTVENFTKYSSLLFSRLKDSDKCLTDKPLLSGQIGAQLLGVASTLKPGLVGSLLLGTGQFVDNLITYFRDRALNDKIKTINSQNMGEAIGCAFEGISHTYCRSRDIDTLLKYTVESEKKQTDVKPNTVVSGLELVSKDLPAFTDWVNLLDSGGPANTPGQANDKKVAFQLEADLRNTIADIQGAIGAQTKILSSSTTPAIDLRKSIMAIGEKASTKCNLSGCSFGFGYSSVAELFIEDKECGIYVFLFSGGQERKRKGTIATNDSCTNYLNLNFPNSPPLSKVSSLLDGLIAEAKISVNNVTSQAAESNPDLILAKAEAIMDKGRSVRDFTANAIAYLESLVNEDDGIIKRPNTNALIAKTREQLKKTLEILDRAVEPGPAITVPGLPGGPLLPRPANPSKKVAELTAALIPNDAFAVSKALKEILSQDMQLKGSRGQLDPNVAILIESSVGDSVNDLLGFTIGVDAANAQLRSSKEKSRNNLSTLSQLFKEPLEERLKKLSAKRDEDDAESLALLCAQVLSVPEALDSDKIGFNLDAHCKGSVYSSRHNNSQIVLNYDKLKAMPLPVRTCAVHDFYRKSYMYGLKKKEIMKARQPEAGDVKK